MPPAPALNERPIAPSPPGGFPLYHLRPMQTERLTFLERCARDYGDVVRLRFPGGRLAHLISSPEGVKQILQDKQKQYDKETSSFIKMRAFLGRGLLTSDGEFWLRQRRLIQPGFHRQRIASFASRMVSDTELLAEEWERLADSGATVDLAHEMMRHTMRIVSKTLLSRDLSGNADRVGRALAFALRHTSARITAIFSTPERFPTPGNLRYLRARATLDELVVGLIEQRRQSGKDEGDLLSMLMLARDESTGQAMSDEQLRDEVMTLFVAGHDTTASALGWAFYLLDGHPEVAARLASELRTVLGGRSPTLEDLARLELTRMVIDEAMRLYPPGWLMGRRAMQDDEIGGFFIPANTFVFVSPWVVQRNPRVWTDPDRFDPGRFSPERASSIPRYAYFPFGGGPRQCIGQSFALMEMQLVLATLFQRFRPKLVPGAVVAVDPQIVLRPRHGLPMTIRRA